MTELEQALLSALERQDAALRALNDRAERQQQQIDQLTRSVELLSESVQRVNASFSGLEHSLSR